MTVVQYPYGSGDLLAHRNVYSYSPFHGEPFLEAWQRQRQAAPKSPPTGHEVVHEDTSALQLIRIARAAIATDSGDAAAWKTLDRLVQRFEVTKRVHHEYSDRWRAVDRDKFRAIPAYVELAETCAEAFERNAQLTYLNALLKLLDTLSALIGDVSRDQQGRIADLIQREAHFVREIRVRAIEPVPQCGPELPDIPRAHLKRTSCVLLACDSARSRAYLEALCRFGLPPEEVIIMGSDNTFEPPAPPARDQWQNLFLPDLQAGLGEICSRAGIRVKHLPERDVNAQSTLAAVSCLEADLVIYSGVGGQIVSEQVLRAAPRFLHMHAGWVPEYRGSTTFYYAMLNNDFPAVSAIFLDPGIDTGPIIERRSYPMPAAGMNVDLVYDPAIRADMLCRVLAKFAATGGIRTDMNQAKDDGTTYYEIHPVLKHIALLSLPGATV